MIPTIIVGSIFGVIMLWALIHTKRDLKASKCAGCSVNNCSSRK
ncbi:FeoB-associated Cys-rich membrane protein (fragment) [Petrocella atlantisensis]|uniref:FeoB-associated Cys-rich membrane protein n=1 Tax=Petrocella atlantisensis TaxID=2173034 RepID=A0A3P7RUD9_9FIRM